MELIPIVIAAGMWGAAWQGQRVHFHCDNASMVSILNRRYSSETTLANLLLCLVFFAAYFSFHLSAEHIAGTLNQAADALSRNDIDSFLSIFPQARHQTVIPDQLHQLVVIRSVAWGSVIWTE
jgi:hypothetical protein